MWLTSRAWKNPAAADRAEGTVIWSWVLSTFLTVNRDEDFHSRILRLTMVIDNGVILLHAGWRQPRSLLHKGSLWFFLTYQYLLNCFGGIYQKKNANASHHNETSSLSYVEGPWLFLLITAVQSWWEMLPNRNPPLPGSSLFERGERIPAGAWLLKSALRSCWPRA